MATFRRFKAAPLKTSSNFNKYFMSVVCPWDYPDVKIPDLNMTPSVSKSVEIVDTFQAKKPEALFWVRFHARRANIRFYTWDSVSSKYYFNKIIIPNEEIADNFRQLVSFRVVLVLFHRPSLVIHLR
jgi:hypothetical protein